MKGSISKNKQTGKWDLVLDIGNDPQTGKRKQKRKRGFDSKKEAENALVKLKHELLNGTYIDANNILLNDQKAPILIIVVCTSIT